MHLIREPLARSTKYLEFQHIAFDSRDGFSIQVFLFVELVDFNGRDYSREGRPRLSGYYFIT